ncbi:hypothetical protein ACJJTC_014754 [Scirpophaga incertulas]
MEKMVRTRSQQRNGNPVVPVMEASPQLSMPAALAELEKAVLEKEHQAKLAELDASGHGSRSSSRHSRDSIDDTAIECECRLSSLGFVRVLRSPRDLQPLLLVALLCLLYPLIP